MSRWKRLAMGAALLLAITSAPVQAQTADPLAEVPDALQLLTQNHLDKPSEQQLVRGALKHVAEQLNALRDAGLTVSLTDDTLAALEARLIQWRDTYRVDERTLARWAVDGMVSTLNDPHTMLFTEEDADQFHSEMENEGSGFGIRLGLIHGNLVIKEVFPGSPAEAAGITAGDYLFAVDGVRLKDIPLEEVYQLLRGEEGSEALLSVYKPAQKRLVELQVMRLPLSIPEATGGRFQGDIGYVGLATFGSDAVYQMRDELNKLLHGKQPIKGLVIDLRDNGGGYLYAARDIASLLMEEGVLMYTTDRNGIEVATWVRNGRPIGVPVRVLVNEWTASASELLAGALQDHGIAKLVGTRTFGKGSAQQVVPLEGGDALKITLHEYVTPKRRTVHQVGLEPDIPVSDDLAQVIAALQSLGVKEFELRENAWGDVQVNGVTFATAEPLFKREKSGLMIRGSVMASLTGDHQLAGRPFVMVDAWKNRNGRGTVQSDTKGTVFRYIRN